ncbi:hypothetical protein FHG66_07660 [Rubellimicrobium rubrum]|uniref:Uncharacterized protein n=1 Tax=Rubellimicrobium rubrum TaxID=2585369 RepID=A0A5C4N2Y6_9RHOB|nr:hypothetical protein [Rubellimicrobium rubrum]TNC50838.1 hypothetical protein FHG66_07660 [Rubellimicrobium rubrum]
MESHLKHPKYGIPLRIALTNQDEIMGLVYVQWSQRIRDLLCERDAFLPVRTTKGTILLNKVNIVRVDILTLEQITKEQELFPEIDFDYLTYNSW